MIGVTRDNAIATLTFTDCRPLSLHDVAFGLALRDAVRDAADSDDIKAIVIRASGDDFSPAPATATQPRATSFDSAWHQAYAAASGLYQTICYCRKIVITAVRGQCAGAGGMLVLCSDFTVATPDASFESPFGVLPEANLVLAAVTMRLNRAKAWLLGGALSANEACDAGLINRVVHAATIDDEAQRWARAAARMPLDGIAMSKINVETCIDAQGVGRDFDMARFNAAALRQVQGEIAAEAGR